MADDELAGLSREELLELVRRQQEALAEREAAVERRDEKIRGLEEEPAQFRRTVKTPESWSVPPSRAQKANRASGRGRKLGPKRGHVGVSQVRSEPDVVVECRPRACAGCGHELPQTGARRTGRSQVVEVPAFAPVVIEAWQYTVACERCGERTAGTYPAGLEPRRAFGPGVEALLSYLHDRHHLSDERLVERARPTYAAIGATVRGSPVINSDRTSARVAGRTQWPWTFQTPEASYHLIAPSRGREVIEAFLAAAAVGFSGAALCPRIAANRRSVEEQASVVPAGASPSATA
jgi:transposase